MVQVPLQTVEEAGRGAVKHCARGAVRVEPGHSCGGMGGTGQHPAAAARIQTHSALCSFTALCCLRKTWLLLYHSAVLHKGIIESLNHRVYGLEGT